MINGGCMTRVWINEWWMVDGWQGDDLMNDECGWMTRVLINEWWMVDVWQGDDLMNDEWWMDDVGMN
jgi:hypothetical protein